MEGCFQVEGVSLHKDVQTKIAGTDNGGIESVWSRLSDQISNCSVCREMENNDDNTWQKCIEATRVFAKALELGRIRGVVSIFAHKDHVLEHLPMYVHLAQDLIQRDILVVFSGCASEPMGEAGVAGSDMFEQTGEGLTEFCDNLDIKPILEMGNGENLDNFREFCRLLANHTGVDDNDVPIAVVLQEWCPETTDLVSLYDMNGNTSFTREADPAQAANIIDEFIHRKRLDMEWCDRYHCSIFS